MNKFTRILIVYVAKKQIFIGVFTIWFYA
ncbi:uncharacterized protein METZ01_LOCUS148730 [marine metagenome]|uniref:Uncharacterized protein n=1 Tax=marine metagenome TaxID=408172 RepID=A0A382A2W0_9ZZZZ